MAEAGPASSPSHHQGAAPGPRCQPGRPVLGEMAQAFVRELVCPLPGRKASKGPLYALYKSAASWPRPGLLIWEGLGFCGYNSRLGSCGSFSGFDNSYCGMKKSRFPEMEGWEQEISCR